MGTRPQLQVIQGGNQQVAPRRRKGRQRASGWDADGYEIDEAFFEDALEALASPPAEPVPERSSLPPPGLYGVEGFAACVASALDDPAERLRQCLTRMRSSMDVVNTAMVLLDEAVDELPLDRAVALREMLEMLNFESHLKAVQQASDEGMKGVTQLGTVLDGLHSIAPADGGAAIPAIPAPPRMPRNAEGER
jgi:hypothetical protein